MIKLKKIVAVALAAAMCMGLSVTAFADDLGDADAILENWQLDSPYYTANPNSAPTAPNGVTVEAVNGKGEANDKLTLTGTGIPYDSDAYNSINTQAEVLDVLKKNGFGVEKNAKIIPVAAGVINGVDEEGVNILTFTLPAAEFTTSAYDNKNGKYHPGDKVYGMFETGENTGVWEMREGTVSAEGKVNFTVDHKGAYVIIKSMKNGKVVALTKNPDGTTQPPVIVDPDDPTKPVPTPDNNGTSSKPSNGQNQGNANANANANALGTSPKTGEF